MTGINMGVGNLGNMTGINMGVGNLGNMTGINRGVGYRGIHGNVGVGNLGNMTGINRGVGYRGIHGNVGNRSPFAMEEEEEEEEELHEGIYTLENFIPYFKQTTILIPDPTRTNRRMTFHHPLSIRQALTKYQSNLRILEDKNSNLRVLKGKNFLRALEDRISKLRGIPRVVYSARTDAFLSFLSTRRVRYFYIAAHGSILPRVYKTNHRTFTMHTGQCGTSTWIESFPEYFTLFSPERRATTINAMFGKMHITTKSLYSHIYTQFPMELSIVKHLEYSLAEAANRSMGLFTYNDADNYVFFPRLLIDGVVRNTDEVFIEGTTSTKIIKSINNIFTDSINIIFFMSCSGLDRTVDPQRYSIPTKLTQASHFSLNKGVKGSGNIAKKVFDKDPVTYLHENTNYKWSEIPDIRIVFVYDAAKTPSEQQTFPIGNIYALYEFWNYLHETNSYVTNRFFVYYETILTPGENIEEENIEEENVEEENVEEENSEEESNENMGLKGLKDLKGMEWSPNKGQIQQRQDTYTPHFVEIGDFFSEVVKS